MEALVLELNLHSCNSGCVLPCGWTIMQCKPEEHTAAAAMA